MLKNGYRTIDSASPYSKERYGVNSPVYRGLGDDFGPYPMPDFDD